MADILKGARATFKVGGKEIATATGDVTIKSPLYCSLIERLDKIFMEEGVSALEVELGRAKLAKIQSELGVAGGMPPSSRITLNTSGGAVSVSLNKLLDDEAWVIKAAKGAHFGADDTFEVPSASIARKPYESDDEFRSRVLGEWTPQPLPSESEIARLIKGALHERFGDRKLTPRTMEDMRDCVREILKEKRPVGVGDGQITVEIHPHTGEAMITVHQLGQNTVEMRRITIDPAEAELASDFLSELRDL